MFVNTHYGCLDPIGFKKGGVNTSIPDCRLQNNYTVRDFEETIAFEETIVCEEQQVLLLLDHSNKCRFGFVGSAISISQFCFYFGMKQHTAVLL